MKKYLNLLIGLLTLPVFGQQEILNFQNLEFKRQLKNVENYSLSDSETNDLAIILAQDKLVKAYLFDANFEKISETNATHLRRKYKEIIGYTVQDSKYTLVFATNNRKKFGFVSIDLKNNQSKTSEIEFNFNAEKYLETIHYKNRLIMLSATKKNELNLREFSADFNFKKIASFQLDSKEKEQSLLSRGFLDFDLFGSFINTIGGVTKIDTRVPNTINRTSKENKLYHQGDRVYITFEKEKEHTILNTIDLSNLTLDTKILSYPEGKIGAFRNYNSFVFNDTFFHIASSRDEMIFQIKDFDNNVVKEYYVDRDSEISFKNSPIIQDGSAYSRKKRNLDETKQYLRKITTGNIGIAIHEVDNNYQISLGSHEDIQDFGGGGFGGFAGAPTGVTTVPLPNGNSLYVPAYNPAFSSYGGYGYSKSVYINGLFNKQFDHIKYAEKFENIFDRIKDYQDELKWNTASDVFLHNEKSYFSYWSTKEQRYTLLQF